jgi:hypothetical protein
MALPRGSAFFQALEIFSRDFPRLGKSGVIVFQGLEVAEDPCRLARQVNQFWG